MDFFFYGALSSSCIESVANDFLVQVKKKSFCFYAPAFRKKRPPPPPVVDFLPRHFSAGKYYYTEPSVLNKKK